MYITYAYGGQPKHKMCKTHGNKPKHVITWIAAYQYMAITSYWTDNIVHMHPVSYVRDIIAGKLY